MIAHAGAARTSVWAEAAPRSRTGGTTLSGSGGFAVGAGGSAAAGACATAGAGAGASCTVKVSTCSGR
jgi:hypothetical protein